MMRPVLLALLQFLVLAPYVIFAQTDSLAAALADTLAPAESVQVAFLPGIGEAWRSPSFEPLESTRLIWSDAKTLEEAVWHVPGGFLRDLGEAGKPSQLTIFGLDTRHISLLMDGRPLNDPVTGMLTLSDIPLEFCDHIQSLDGVESLFAGTPKASSLNLVTRWYNTLRPITRIRFIQDPKETLLTDAFFSQNIFRGINLQMGLLRQASQGRFLNAAHDGWNVRTRLRWNASTAINAAMTYLYSRSSTGLNGGIDLLSSADPFDSRSARAVDERAYGLSTRQDLTVNALARLFDDTSSTTHATAFLSSSEREYVQLNPGNIPFRREFVRGGRYGVRLEQRLNSTVGSFAIAAEQEWRGSEPTALMPFTSEFQSAISASAQLTLLDFVVPSATIRSERMYKTVKPSYGFGLRFDAASWIAFEGTMGVSARFPTLQERYMTDSLLLRRMEIGPERHEFFTLGMTIRSETWGRVTVGTFRRTIGDAITIRPDLTDSGTLAVGLQPARRLVTEGVTSSASIAWAGIEFEGTATYTKVREDDAEKKPVPVILLGGELAYHGIMFGDALEGRFGTRIRFSDRYLGTTYDPLLNVYVENQTYRLGRAATIDLFAVLQIGGAYVTLAMDNILNLEYLTVPVYPMTPRQFRVGVNWTFLD